MEYEQNVSIPFVEGYTERQTYYEVPQVERISNVGKGTGSADVICVDNGCRVVT